ncbi:hypothetical protein HPB50_004957 [Hyalomma asiaticum]|uniref:Uncharacterized protein n=1 Tax=Hyalomma asiaticum TaxID=266040 RepID=A0ACB7RRW2_HYAAI|nr:hypothetical protein HPB50_004957 [Hyalomma asiaticum]
MDEEFLSTGTDVPFSEFVAIDNDVPTCEPQSIAEIIAEVVGDNAVEVAADEDPEDNGENEGLRPPATFAEALAGLEALQSFFRTKDNENVDKALQCVLKELFLSKGRSTSHWVIYAGCHIGFLPSGDEREAVYSPDVFTVFQAQQKVAEEQTAQLQRLRDETRQLQQRVHQLEAE